MVRFLSFVIIFMFLCLTHGFSVEIGEVLDSLESEHTQVLDHSMLNNGYNGTGGIDVASAEPITMAKILNNPAHNDHVADNRDSLNNVEVIDVEPKSGNAYIQEGAWILRISGSLITIDQARIAGETAQHISIVTDQPIIKISDTFEGAITSISRMKRKK